MHHVIRVKIAVKECACNYYYLDVHLGVVMNQPCSDLVQS